MKTTLIAAALAALTLAMPAAAPAGSPRAEAGTSAIVLADGRVLQGRIRALQESRYLVQGELDGEQVVLELPAAQIASVGGAATLPAYDPADPVRETQFYEQVDARGGVTNWSTMELRNEGRTLMTQVRWGLADWELERTKHMRVLDLYGHELHPQVEARGEGHGLTIDLAVPVPPLTTQTLGVGYRDEGVVHAEGDHWSYTFTGDFPEDRLISRLVQLPTGATVLGTTPEATYTADSKGAPLIFWRRYYAARERLPLTVRYRLP
jgi:hypothetical protein